MLMEINKIYNIDVIEFMSKIPEKSIDLVVTDPPYLISYKSKRRKEKGHKFSYEIKNDNNPELIKAYIKECYRILKDNTAAIAAIDTNRNYIGCEIDSDYFKIAQERIYSHKTQMDLFNEI